MMGFGGGFMWILWISLIVIVVVVATRLTSGNRGRSGSDSERERSAMEILEARYARGEIDRDEFEEKKRDLSG